MPAATELLGHRRHIHFAATAKTHFHSAILLFIRNEGTFDSDNPKTPVDHVLGVGCLGTGPSEILASSRQPGQATVTGQFDPVEQPTANPDPSL